MPKFTDFGLPLLLLSASLGLARAAPTAEPILTAERQVTSQPASDIRSAKPIPQSLPASESDDSRLDSVDELRANARQSTETVATLLEALASQDAQLRRRAVMSLGGKGPQAKVAVPALEKMLRDPDSADRLEAAIAIGRIGPDAKSAAPSLEALQQDGDSTVRAAASQALTSVCWELGAFCKPDDVPPSTVQSTNAIYLNIAPREDAPGHPSEGWCAEVAIQEALLSLGAYFPQKIINAAGHPEHPDLYADEIPTALRNLHVKYDAWPWNGPRQELPRFLRWTRRWIAAGHPVLVGVKIYPTEHNDWSLDHFCLCTGTADHALLLNSAWGYRVRRTERQLTSLQEGFSFANDQDRYYGISIQGMERHPGPPKVSLHVLCEAGGSMNVAVKCDDLEPGRLYTLLKSSDGSDSAGTPMAAVRTDRGPKAIYDRIAKGRPCIYWCNR
jgi:hypothetical protein